MTDKFEKNLHIICEMMTYYHFIGATDCKAEMSAMSDGTRFTMSAPVPCIRPAALRELSEALNIPRQREVEQEFWELSGEAGKSGELTLVGIMLDSAEVLYKNGILTITAIRLD